MRNTLKNKKGITLISLVITVIIMLILSGVAILVITNDGGLFNKTRIATNEYNNAVAQENAKMQARINMLDKDMLGIAEGTSDITSPSVPTIVASDVEETGFKLTATGEDETGIAKYEFYINNTLENTITTTEEIAMCNVNGKLGATTYNCYVIVYDLAGNMKESQSLMVTTKKPLISAKVKLGDYVSYRGGSNPVCESWRVLSIKNGIVTLISTDAIKGVEVYGKYIFHVESRVSTENLTNLCKTYADGVYATSSRSVNYDDINNMNLSNTKAARNYIGQSVIAYWLDTTFEERSIMYMYCHYKGLWAVKNNQSIEKIYLLSAFGGDIEDTQNANTYSYTYGVRPVVTLKPNVLAANGDGTESNPWKLEI